MKHIPTLLTIDSDIANFPLHSGITAFIFKLNNSNLPQISVTAHALINGLLRLSDFIALFHRSGPEKFMNSFHADGLLRHMQARLAHMYTMDTSRLFLT